MSSTSPLKALFDLRPASLGARPAARASGARNDFGSMLRTAAKDEAGPSADARRAPDAPARPRDTKPAAGPEAPAAQDTQAPQDAPTAQAAATAGEAAGANAAMGPAQAGAANGPAGAAAETPAAALEQGTPQAGPLPGQATADATPDPDAAAAQPGVPDSQAVPAAASDAAPGGSVPIPKGMTAVHEAAPPSTKGLANARGPRTDVQREKPPGATTDAPGRSEVSQLAREVAAQIRREVASTQPAHVPAAQPAEERPAPQAPRATRAFDSQAAGARAQDTRPDAAGPAADASASGSQGDAGTRGARSEAMALSALPEEPEAAAPAARPAAGQAPPQAVPAALEPREAAAAAEAREPAPAAASTPAHRIFEQVVKQISVKQLGDGSSQATLRLHPESLGRVEIRLEMQDGHLKAHITAASDEVRDALKQYLPELQKALAQGRGALQGLSVEVNRQRDGREQQGTFQKAQARRSRAAGSVQGPAPRAAENRPRIQGGLDLYV